MPYLYVHEKVADYTQWRTVYDSLASAKQARGFIQATVFQNTADPHEVVLLERWASLDEARSWGQSPELREAMKDAGALPPAVFLFLDEA
jgi:heme-degrading monooxygenase HmoA